MVTYTCPSSRSVPTCQIYDGTDFTESSSCSVLRYSAEETVCSCSVAADSSSGSRRLAVEASGSSSLSQYSSSTSLEQLSTYSVSEVDDSPGSTPAPSEGAKEDDDISIYAIVVILITIYAILGTVGVCLALAIGLCNSRGASTAKQQVKNGVNTAHPTTDTEDGEGSGSSSVLSLSEAKSLNRKSVREASPGWLGLFSAKASAPKEEELRDVEKAGADRPHHHHHHTHDHHHHRHNHHTHDSSAVASSEHDHEGIWDDRDSVSGSDSEMSV